MRRIAEDLWIGGNVEITAGDALVSNEVSLADFGERAAVVIKRAEVQVINTAVAIAYGTLKTTLGFSMVLSGKGITGSAISPFLVDNYIAGGHISRLSDAAPAAAVLDVPGDFIKDIPFNPQPEIFINAVLFGVTVTAGAILCRANLLYDVYQLTANEYISTV